MMSYILSRQAPSPPRWDKMKVGLIGVGRIGMVHARTLADLDFARTQAVADETGAKAVPVVEDLFAAGLDAVVVAAAAPAYGLPGTRPYAWFLRSRAARLRPGGQRRGSKHMHGR